MWPYRSNSQRVSCSASLLLRDDWQLSCLHHCRLIFVRGHLFDRGSEGLLSQETVYDCFSALQGFTYRRAMLLISLCRWNYVCINLYCILSHQSTIYLEDFYYCYYYALHFIVSFDHVVITAKAMQHEYTTEIYSNDYYLSRIICEEDNTHTCNPFLYQAVIWFLMMHTL